MHAHSPAHNVSILNAMSCIKPFSISPISIAFAQLSSFNSVSVEIGPHARTHDTDICYMMYDDVRDMMVFSVNTEHVSGYACAYDTTVRIGRLLKQNIVFK